MHKVAEDKTSPKLLGFDRLEVVPDRRSREPEDEKWTHRTQLFLIP
jgi:hypothetical protein